MSAVEDYKPARLLTVNTGPRSRHYAFSTAMWTVRGLTTDIRLICAPHAPHSLGQRKSFPWAQVHFHWNGSLQQTHFRTWSTLRHRSIVHKGHGFIEDRVPVQLRDLHSAQSALSFCPTSVLPLRWLPPSFRSSWRPPPSCALLTALTAMGCLRVTQSIQMHPNVDLRCCFKSYKRCKQGLRHRAGFYSLQLSAPATALRSERFYVGPTQGCHHGVLL